MNECTNTGAMLVFSNYPTRHAQPIKSLIFPKKLLGMRRPDLSCCTHVQYPVTSAQMGHHVLDRVYNLHQLILLAQVQTFEMK